MVSLFHQHRVLQVKVIKIVEKEGDNVLTDVKADMLN